MTLTIDHTEQSIDGSVKLRLITAEGYPLEAVLMRFARGGAGKAGRSTLAPRFTACLSSQSGCALSCTFCATGRMKLGRSLSRDEIVGQFRALRDQHLAAGGDKIDNIVMMGMGEPFHNYDEVLGAIRTIVDPREIGLAARRIAISTVGWVPGIERLATEDVPVKLTLSLHAPNDELRTTLMPVNKRYPIERLMQACQTYYDATNRTIFIAYLMLEGINDSTDHARQLIDILSRNDDTSMFHVNMISYNPIDTEFVGSPDHVVDEFTAVLDDAGIKHSYRVSHARDISAACGQLAAPMPPRARLSDPR